MQTEIRLLQAIGNSFEIRDKKAKEVQKKSAKSLSILKIDADGKD